jgi:hypothetical protein
MSRQAAASFCVDEYEALQLLEKRAIQANDPPLLEQIETVRLEYLDDLSCQQPKTEIEGLKSLKFAIWLVEQLQKHKMNQTVARLALNAALFESQENGINGFVLSQIRQALDALPNKSQELDYWSELHATLNGFLRGLATPKLAYEKRAN